MASRSRHLAVMRSEQRYRWVRCLLPRAESGHPDLPRASAEPAAAVKGRRPDPERGERVDSRAVRRSYPDVVDGSSPREGAEHGSSRASGLPGCRQRAAGRRPARCGGSERDVVGIRLAGRRGLGPAGGLAPYLDVDAVELERGMAAISRTLAAPTERRRIARIGSWEIREDRCKRSRPGWPERGDGP